MLTRLAYLRRRKLENRKERNRSKQTSIDGDDASSLSSLSTTRQKPSPEPLEQTLSIEAILFGKNNRRSQQDRTPPRRNTLRRSKSHDVEQGMSPTVTEPMTPSPNNKNSRMDGPAHSAPFDLLRQCSVPSDESSIRQARDSFFSQMKDDAVPDDEKTIRSQLEEACGGWLPFQLDDDELS